MVSYGLNEREEIDYDAMRTLALREQAQADHRGRLGLLAAHRLRALRRRLRGRWAPILMVDMAHYAGLIAAGVYPNPVPHADVVTSTTHKTLRGPRGGIILMKTSAIAKAINSADLPRHPGRPADARDRRQGGGVQGGAAIRQFKAYQQQVLKNASVLADTLVKRGLRIVSGRTESHVMLVDLRPKGITGKDAETRARRCPHHLQQERDPQRPAKAAW